MKVSEIMYALCSKCNLLLQKMIEIIYIYFRILETWTFIRWDIFTKYVKVN